MARLSKDELIEVWKDTESKFPNFGTTINSYKIKSRKINTYSPNIWVENMDCVEVARKLSKEGKTCMLNMASFKHPGGGVKKGSMAQEEELARRSNLMVTLETFEYPLSIDDVIYSSGVTFFKDGNYNDIEPFLCDIITIAALNLNGTNLPEHIMKNYYGIMTSKIESMFENALINGCENIILSAFGCGVFKNDPTIVAQMFFDRVKKYNNKFKNIVFAIINDHNADNNNYQIFKDIIEQ